MWGNYSSSFENECMSQKYVQTKLPHGLFPYKNHALMPLRHFIEHLVGARLGINSKRTGTMWHVPLLQNVLQAQGHPIQTPNSTQSSKKTKQNCPAYLSTIPQFRAPKGDQNTPMKSQKAQGWNTYLLVMNKSAKWNQKMRKMMTLGLQTRKSRGYGF